LAEKGKSINDLLQLLWSDYKKNPHRGLVDNDVYLMIETVGGQEIRENLNS